MSSARKRFWQAVGVVHDAAGAAVQLDGRSVRLPDGAVLAVQSDALAAAIAEEWRAIAPQAAFSPEDLPLTRIAGTMIERVAPDAAQVRAQLLRIGLNDLLCYRASGVLGQHQATQFAPWLAWIAQRGVVLQHTTDMTPVVQTAETHAALVACLAACDVAQLAALGVAAQASGSLVIALALIEGALSVEAALELCTLDERAQMKAWGEDPDIADAIADKGRDLELASRFCALARNELRKS